MWGFASCILGLLLLQMPAVRNTVLNNNNEPTYEELLLQVQRLDQKVDTTLAIVNAMKLGFNAKMFIQKSMLANAIGDWDAKLTNTTIKWDSDLQNTNSNLEKVKNKWNSDLNSTNSNLERAKTKWNSDLANTNRSLENAKTKWNSTYARQEASFLAIKSSGNAPASSVLVFNVIQHNDAPSGYGYNSGNGYFRCPYDGTYAFYVTIVRNYKSGNPTWRFYLKKGSSVLVEIAGDVPNNSYDDDQTMSGAAVTPCRRGENVYVQNADGTTRTMDLLGSYGPTHFAGFKIY